MPSNLPLNLEVSIRGRDDGTLEAVYIQLIDGEVFRTREIQEDILLADYSEDGHLLGIEVLAPVKLTDLEKLVEEHSLRNTLRRFIQRSAPREMVTA